MSSASSNIQNWRHTTLDTALIVPDLDCYQAWITSQGPAQDHPQQSLPSLDEVHPTNIRVKCKLSKSYQGLGFFLTFLQKLKLISHLSDVSAENQDCVLQASLQRLGSEGPEASSRPATSATILAEDSS